MLCSPCEYLRTVFAGIIGIPCYLLIVISWLGLNFVPSSILVLTQEPLIRILIVGGAAFPLIFSIFLYWCVTCSADGNGHKCSTCSIFTDIILLIFLGFSFYGKADFDSWIFFVIIFIKFLGGFCDPTHTFLTNIKSEDGANQYMVDVMNLPPFIEFHVEAYHYETRHRTVHYTDSNGRSQTRHETYQEKVVTLRRSERYNFASWNDVSDPHQFAVPQFQEILKIEISSIIQAADNQSRDHFDRSWNEFHDKYRNADVHVDFTQNKGIENLPTDSLLAFLDVDNKPEALSSIPFIFLGLTPWQGAYGLWLDRISYHEPREFTKQFSQFEKLEPKTRIKEIEWIKLGATNGFINSFWYNGFRRNNINESAFSPVFSDSFGVSNQAVVSPIVQPINQSNQVQVQMNVNVQPIDNQAFNNQIQNQPYQEMNVVSMDYSNAGLYSQDPMNYNQPNNF
eukprot:TRINITY_DN960_c0_g1_i1.p1 TRINITY_DN960_c0_g1~~TRINITY_DN960_c0_g1_i1.p1  ORF type:complete len:453 (+),score=107.05 TRINITY_DN960_c0_g1_i1:286-1644(+)